MNLLNEINEFRKGLEMFSKNVIQKDDRILSGLTLIAGAVAMQAQATAEQTQLMEEVAMNAPGLGYADVFPDGREEELD
jgi:hypothetical protein